MPIPLRAKPPEQPARPIAWWSHCPWPIPPALPASVLVGSAYLATLAPTVFTLDGAEFTTAAYTLGLSHAPGYPVYLLLLHLFQYIPLGDIGYRSNLFSALVSVGTVAGITTLVGHLTRHWWAALVAGVCFGLCYYTWSLAVIAEVYTLQTLLLVGILLVLWYWSQSARPRFLLLAAALTGLTLANNPATILWMPGFLLLLWGIPQRKTLSPHVWVATVGALLAGFLPLLYLPWRAGANPAFSSAGFYDVQGHFHSYNLAHGPTLLWYLSGGTFKGMIFAYTLPELSGEIVHFLHALWAAFMGIGIPLGIWGGWWLYHQHRVWLSSLIMIGTLHSGFFIGYRAPDKATMFLPVFVIWAILVGCGVSRIIDWVPPQWRWGSLGLPLALLLVNSPLVNVRDTWDFHDTAYARLHQAEPRALYMAYWGEAAAMQYHQVVTGMRQDVTVVNVLLIERPTLYQLIERALLDNRPVYVTHAMPGLVYRYRLVAVDYGYLVLKEGKEKGGWYGEDSQTGCHRVGDGAQPGVVTPCGVALSCASSGRIVAG